MTVSKTMRIMRLQEWSKQVLDCENSGMSVREWCMESGLDPKSYYYRRRRVREELLDASENNKKSLALRGSSSEEISSPVFASIPISSRISSSYGTAVAVQIGTYVAEINNGADLETVEGVLRTLSRL